MEFYYQKMSTDNLSKIISELPKRNDISDESKSATVIYYGHSNNNDTMQAITHYLDRFNSIDINNNNDYNNNEMMSEISKQNENIQVPIIDIKNGDIVKINEINTPHNFYLIKNDYSTNFNFKNFEQHMNEYYSNGINRVKLIDVLDGNSIKNQTFGVAKNPLKSSLNADDDYNGKNGNWSRIQVCNHSDRRISQCFFIDYGFVTPIDTDDIYQLDDCFKYFPFRSFKAKLYDVKPKKEFWTLAETSYFESLTKNQPLKIELKSQLGENHYECNLMDGPVCINEELRTFISFSS